MNDTFDVPGFSTCFYCIASPPKYQNLPDIELHSIIVRDRKTGKWTEFSEEYKNGKVYK